MCCSGNMTGVLQKAKSLEGGRKTPQLESCVRPAPREGTFVDNYDRWETGLIDVKNPFIEKDQFPGTVIPATTEWTYEETCRFA